MYGIYNIYICLCNEINMMFLNLIY
eukprot:UN05911